MLEITRTIATCINLTNLCLFSLIVTQEMKQLAEASSRVDWRSPLFPAGVLEMYAGHSVALWGKERQRACRFHSP